MVIIYFSILSAEFLFSSGHLVSNTMYVCQVASFMSDSLQTRLLCPWGFSRHEYWVACLALLQRTFLTQRLNLCLLCLLHWQMNSLLLPSSTSGKESTCQCRRLRCSFDPWVKKIPWSRKWQVTPIFLPGKSQGQRNQVGYCPLGCKKSNTN